ncbi:uncharacterized protein K452DRAFT_343063 [Aplosporella prunicola CBS 121167]|uniref:Heterokaryon incompatibility domain-containing protein n=1 Tax=Aplosporella prunicola CBS 121167 TaxID=1176127 RepID=A0A6A6AX58_9PEZI|nr:uncharacterized protein K452DRAFT_343063 [Aplosporella prunicola CBS 121167]KAF2136519.1 hypothetical protein K452DRAFT_343063 [Aplosporella prunicola CBS 121167]
MLQQIHECIQKHADCKNEMNPVLPTRLLDIGTEKEPKVKLYETAGERRKYAALTHRWGKKILITTTKSTLAARKTAIAWSELSPTFQDAIKVTRMLDLRYLWIDSLCIIQDDADDWQVEASKMADIYEKAYVTISANTTTSSLLSPSTTPTLLEGIVGKTPADHLLASRAWCFQERLLATRLLHFTDAELVFECKAGCRCECESPHRNSTSAKQTTYLKNLYAGIVRPEYVARLHIAEDPWEGWKLVVGPYARKELTQPSDVLPALAGMAARMQSERLGRYVAGLWEAYLADGLF